VNYHWVPTQGVKNLTALARCDRGCQEHMVWPFTQCDPDYGRRVAEG
jgi:catalase